MGRRVFTAILPGVSLPPYSSTISTAAVVSSTSFSRITLTIDLLVLSILFDNGEGPCRVNYPIYNQFREMSRTTGVARSHIGRTAKEVTLVRDRLRISTRLNIDPFVFR